MRTRRRKTRKRRRRRFYKRRRGTRRRRRRRRGRMTRGRRRGGSKMAEANAVLQSAAQLGDVAVSVKSGKTSKVDGAKELFSIVESNKAVKGAGAQLPITVLCDSADVVADAACEIIGLGPEDPLADVCAYEMLTHVAKWCKNFISKHEPSALKRILNNPMHIVKVLAAKKKGLSVLSSMAVKSGHMGVEV